MRAMRCDVTAVDGAEERSGNERVMCGVAKAGRSMEEGTSNAWR